MIGAILWGIACWYFGIPCSKSHSLIAGITGGAIAMNGWAGVVPAEWAKVIYGMVFSLVAGFVLGWLFTRLIEWIFKFVQRQAANKLFTIIQDIAAVALSFLHGAQDGQKFMSIAMLGIALSFGSSTPDSSGFPLWIMVICSAAISLGTILGGKRIIKSVGMDMVKLEKYQGCAAELLHDVYASGCESYRHAGVDGPLQHVCHYGRGRREIAQARELVYCEKHAHGVDHHVSGMRLYWIFACENLHDVRLVSATGALVRRSI